MNRASSPLATFHVTGVRPEHASKQVTHEVLQPALFSHFHDLRSLRHDFPLVLVAGDSDHGPLKSLSDIFDEILRDIAPRGSSGEKTRRQLLSLEQEIRSQSPKGRTSGFEELWDQAQHHLLTRISADDHHEFEELLTKARQSPGYEGTVCDCNHGLPTRLLRHLWMQARKPGDRVLYMRVKRLVKALEEILQLDTMHSGKAHDAGFLQCSMGTTDSALFDFQVMAQMLETAPVGKPLAAKRRRRIGDAISILKSQKFVCGNLNTGVSTGGNKLFKFDFDDCSTAVSAFHKRLPDMAALIKAISIAELEIANRYEEKRHDVFFEGFNANALGPEDFSMFPPYLVTVVGEPVTAQLKSDILESLGNGLPLKVMVQHDDILGPPPDATGQLSFGVRGQQLADMALGLNQVFVMQASSSSLYRLRESLSRGLGSSLPALFSIYSGASGNAPDKIEPYLLAAAATESRAFPSFVKDPARGKGQAGNFSLGGNPAMKSNWAAHPLQFEDEEHHLQTEEVAFTFIDFVASDPRHAGHFVTVPKNKWSEDMLSLPEFLKLDSNDRVKKIPYTLLHDAPGVLQRAVMDHRLIDAEVRCQEHWRALQELAGINNSHVCAALAEAESAWQHEKQQLTQQASQQAAAVAAPATQPDVQPTNSASATPAVVEATIEPQPASGEEPWIETPRCTTCNECTGLNDRMFAYNEDMQAYIADPRAGTYRDLVEAAETCQVAIIHPGKPANADESGVDDLLARAEPFL